MNKFTIHDRGKYFSAEIFQKCLVFISAKNTWNILVALLEIIRGNLMEYWKYWKYN